MKALLFIALLTFSLNIFASDTIVSLDGLRELSKKQGEVIDLVEALTVANNGSVQYGKCYLGVLVANEVIKVYINDKSVNPLITAITGTEWIKITSGESMRKIISVTFGKYIWKKVNNGTIVKPDYQMLRVVTSSSSCQSD